MEKQPWNKEATTSYVSTPGRDFTGIYLHVHMFSGYVDWFMHDHSREDLKTMGKSVTLQRCGRDVCNGR